MAMPTRLAFRLAASRGALFSPATATPLHPLSSITPPTCPPSHHTQHRQYAVSTMADQARKVAIIGSGTIGLSFAALHLTRNPLCVVKIFDSRPDLAEYVDKHLPQYLPEGEQMSKKTRSRLTLTKTLDEAIADANIVQEQGPETLEFKAGLWPHVEALAKRDALLWSSTSGIPASAQSTGMRDNGRVMVVHPYNPPHVMPLLEVVPSPNTRPELVERTLAYWRELGRTPVVIQKECTGFVANRLAFALLREACSLVQKGVIGVKDIDAVVTASMGPRYAVIGPFKACHAGGGDDGIAAFFDKIGATIQDCWEASERDIRAGDISMGKEWQKDVIAQTEETYGTIDFAERDRTTRAVLEAVATNIKAKEKA